ncbi:ABC transporter substrate-binding protein [Elioraea tepida]|uniref:ABC transporter substrate-binding protein n=1 Tax=Elioraea tepida TaxID=2843330 RepID=A0A975U203_9PROT|nr:ABC transporter substrate-binding protein [Elioraea tepida]QXM24931.1 ABC transporter substrate-binding protein [Elioraea tepida]
MRRRTLIVGLGGAAAAGFAAPALRAQPREVRLAEQFGIGYLPLSIMKVRKLLEAEARARGVEVTTAWVRFASGTAMNEALISDNLDFASGGVGPLLTIWARTRGNLDVKGVAALNSMPLYLNTINPNVKTIADFTEKDRIALPAVKVSIQAVILQMAAEKAFGPGNHTRLDHLTVSMSHPDGMAAMLSGRSEITAHFSSAPFQYQQLADPRVRRVLNSYDVLGGPHTFNSVWAMGRYRSGNPEIMAAFIAALDRAMGMIKDDPEGMAELWIADQGSRLSKDDAVKIIRDPEIAWTTTPQKIMAFAAFMHRNGSIRARPERWQDVYVEDIAHLLGS